MSWKFYKHENGCEMAYQLVDGILTINPTANLLKDGTVEVYDDMSEEQVQLFADGSFKFLTEGYNEFTQFNCCGQLWAMLELINQSLNQYYPMNQYPILNKASILQEEPVVKILSHEYDKDKGRYTMDLAFTFTLDGKTYTGEQQFIKYMFLDNELLEKTWTVTEMANFIVHISKFSFDMETNVGRKDYLCLDRDMEALFLNK